MDVPLARPLIGPEEQAAVAGVMASGGLAQGPEVAAFEDEFAKLVDGRHCVAVNSGTSALHLSLLALGIGPGDEVVVPSFTFAATANAVRLAGATPVFADIRAHDYCLDPVAVRAAVTPRTRAVMPVHLYGHPAAMDEIAAVAAEHSLLVVEDAAQAHAASWQGRPAGAWGDAACFSFYPTKNMTTGEGGLVVTPDPDTARTLRLLRNQGMERRYENELVGFNVRMTDIGGAIGRVQLRKLDGWTEQRRANAAFLSRELRGVTVPTEAPGAVHVYHQYTVRSDRRDDLQAHLARAGVGSGVYYPVPVHRLPAFGAQLDLPETERAAREVLSLPVGPHLAQEQLEHVVAAVNGFAA
jgi:perosamine synthetase